MLGPETIRSSLGSTVELENRCFIGDINLFPSFSSKVRDSLGLDAAGVWTLLMS